MVYATLLQKFLKRTIYSEEKKPEMKYIQILTLAFSEKWVTFTLFAYWYSQQLSWLSFIRKE